jgi:hypothetical protein
MGIWDRFGRGAGTQPASAAQPLTDEQAIARYRYMLRTAPPEAIEQAHAEAFAALTPEQRRMVLEELKREMPEIERAAATRAGDTPGALAQLATRAEIRQPGAMERIFGGVGAAPGWSSPGSNFGGAGLGSMMAGSFLASMAGSVLGSMVAQHFFHSHPEANHLFGAGGDSFFDRPDASRLDDLDKSVQEVYGDRGADAAPDDSIIDAADDSGMFDDGNFLDT